MNGAFFKTYIWKYIKKIRFENCAWQYLWPIYERSFVSFIYGKLTPTLGRMEIIIDLAAYSKNTSRNFETFFS